jgi:hypothetical protein
MSEDLALPVVGAAVEEVDFGFETPEVEGAETPEVETPAGEEIETPEGEGEESTETPDDDKIDGREVPAKVRSALKQLREAHPEMAKELDALRNSFGHADAYRQVFPTPQDARTAHADLQSLADLGGVAGVKQQLDNVDEIDNLLADGDPAVLDKIAEFAGEGLNKLVPTILDRLESSDAAAYAAAVSPHVIKGVIASGLPKAIGDLNYCLEMANMKGASAEFQGEWNKKADNLLTQITTWAKSLKEPAKADPTKVPAADVKLTAREQAIQQKEQQYFNNEVKTATATHIDGGIGKELTPYLSRVKLPETAKADLIDGIKNEMGRLAFADKKYQDDLKALKGAKKPDAGKIAAFINAKAAQLTAQAVKTVFNKRYPQKAGAAKAAPVKGAKTVAAAPGKPTIVQQLPDRSLIDFNKTTQDQMMRGIRVLKSGKVVQVAS